MKKTKKMISAMLVVFLLSLLINFNVFASNADFMQRAEFSDDFKKWLELSDEEKEKVIMPIAYDVKYTETKTNNFMNMARMLKANASQRFSLKDIIPDNIVIRNQGNTNSCWTFAALSSLETNLALSNYRNGINLSKVYDFSERHMEYATSKTFANDVKNKMGFNRQVGEGGNRFMATSYLTNGSGAIPESEMPFEDNENIVNISKIQDKTVSSRVYDIVFFPDYGEETDTVNKLEIMNQIKQHIQNYGSVQASIHGGSSDVSEYQCYNNDTGAKFCNDADTHAKDHAISIIGWDDNYSTDHFPEGSKPTSNGAWIVRNSWGTKVLVGTLIQYKQAIFQQYQQECIDKGWNSAEEIPDETAKQIAETNGYTVENNNIYLKYGDNGIIYISYEDVNISKEMFGIIKATDTVDYDYIYQYDELFPWYPMTITNSNTIMLCNLFNKQSTGTEYLTQVSLYAPETYTCKVYVNPNGTSKAKSDLQPVMLKAGEKETISAGYHTLEFSKPVEITADSFAVVVEIQGTETNSVTFTQESRYENVEAWNEAIIETGKCFCMMGNNLDSNQWVDLGTIADINPSLANGDTSIKAFTTTELVDGSLKNIEIATPPTKTSYYEGENFDRTGMIIKANYNRKANSSVELDSSSYSITNGTNLQAGQTNVTITYEDKSVEQTISVEKNSVVELQIKTAPNKTEYKEGESFDKTGMVVEATYKNGDKKEIADYEIKNGNNLKANQSEVIISYEDKQINQPITVTPNPLQEINVTKAPNKTKYVVGQNFDKTGMVVTGTYQDESTQEIIEYTIEDGTNLTKGQESVTIKYEDKTTTQAIEVEEKVITTIAISKNPSKTKYIQNKEELDLTGGKLKITYNDGSAEEIELTSNQVTISGFDNKTLGKNTITITYQSKTTTLEVEIIAEEVAKNSDFENMTIKANSLKYYTFTNKDTQEYIVIDLTLNDIIRNTENDKCEYYYYLSTDNNKEDIQDWVKIDKEQTANNKLELSINTKDIKNYDEILGADTVYLYIKEVAIKGSSQSVLISEPVEMEGDVDVLEIYVDNVKIDFNTNPEKPDDTTAPGKLPQTGTTAIIILSVIGIITLVGVTYYIRYKKLNDVK